MNKEKLVRSIEKKQIFHLKNAMLPSPTWENFIDTLNTKFNEPDGSVPDPRVISKIDKQGVTRPTDILIYNKLDPVIFKVVEYSNNQFLHNHMKHAENFSNSFKDIFPHHTIKAIINFVGNEYKYWVHKDDYDVLSWHCIGQMEWRIYSGVEDYKLDTQDFEELNYVSYILNPGDLIYVPAGTVHSVATSEPRASLILDGS